MQDHGHYIPDHPVAVPLQLVSNAKTQQIKFGKVELVRVQVMGIVSSIEINESDMEFVITNEKGDSRVTVQKMLNSSFPREWAQALKVGDRAGVFGKVRVMEGGETFLNALALHVVTEDQFEAFDTMCRLSEKFYNKHSATLPPGTSTNAPSKFGLKERLGNLDRFPIVLLEESSSNENNMGDWPVEIEYLAAGISLDGNMQDQNKDNVKNNDVEMEEEDSFDAGPIKTVVSNEDEKIHVSNGENETDSFETAGAFTVQASKNVQILDSFDETPVKTESDLPVKEEIEYDSFENA